MSDTSPMDMPLSGLRLVEASAGTGKTFSLAGLYLRLLVEKRLDVRDILVMTFTRAATQELRERIRARIAAAARIAADPSSAGSGADDALARKLLQQSGEAPGELARRLRDAAVRMDEATITTIHGFSQRAVAENAFDSAVAFDRGEQVDDRELLVETVTDYWRRQVIGADIETASAFLAHWPTPDTLAADLRQILETPHLRLAGPSSAQASGEAEQAVREWSAIAPRMQALLEQIEGAGEFTANGKLRKAVTAAGGAAALFRDINAEVLAEQGARIPSVLALLCAEELPKQLKGKAKKAGIPQEFTDSVAALLQSRALARLAMLRVAAAAVREHISRRKRERRVYSFNDMIQALHDAVVDPVQGPALVEALRRRWPWALVDEFQDTDPLQYAILKSIYHGSAGDVGMIMIGDPKQAIYGFRGGDVFAYLKAADDAQGRYSLDTNYRSTSQVLDVVEAVFGMAGDHAFMIPDIRFQHVKAGRADGDTVIRRQGRPLPALTLWTTEPGDNGKPLAAGAARTLLADATVREIRRLLASETGATVDRQEESRPLAAGDICVLVNSNREAAEFQVRLARAGIAAACLHQSSVFDSEQAAQLQRILEAAAAPADPHRVRAALITELFGHRLGDLLMLAENDHAWLAAMDIFQQAHERWSGNGVLAMLEPLVQEAGQHLLLLEDGERRMTNWLHLAERLQEAEIETFGMAGLTRWLSERRHQGEGPEASEDAQLRLESDENLVRIATVHKVKGLQFAVVMLPYAPLLGTGGTRFDKPDEPPFRFHDPDGNAWLDVGCGESDAHAAQAVRERRAEAMRLLYVALTRAEQALYLPWGLINGAQNSAMAWLFHQRDGATDDAWQTSNTQYGSWYTADNVAARLQELAACGGDAIVLHALSANVPQLDALTPQAEPLGPARDDLPAPAEPWQMLSYSALVRGEAAAPAAESGVDDESRLPEDGTPTDGGLEGLSGTGFGSAVHDILEDADFKAWPGPDAAVGEQDRLLIHRHLLRRGMVIPEGERGTKLVQAVGTLVSRCLHTPLPELGPLARVPPERRLAEMGFAMRLGGQTAGAVSRLLRDHGYLGLLSEEYNSRVLYGLMQGFIDLLVEHDGRYWVLDYKTNWLGALRSDYRPARLSAAVRHGHYDLQYLIYMAALHRHLARRRPDYDPVHHLGGVQYLFVRGMNGRDEQTGIFTDRPGVDLILALDRMLDNREARA
ncbi:MAG: exodeoxyribonuclease V subunit beta [Ectothiorhodospiraceae bacterium]|nr:exodeoxyribonuclease V subunit beta [Ectothiorhodospiraceae bacterium]